MRTPHIKSMISIIARKPELGSTGSAEIHGILNYLIGFFLSLILTALAFFVAQSNVIWAPGIPVALIALAIAQIGVHLAFFLHLTTGSDNINNSLALAFGTLVVTLVIAGTLWIMSSMNHHSFETVFGNKSMHSYHGSSLHPSSSPSFRLSPDHIQIGKKVTEVLCHIGQQVEINQKCAELEDPDEKSAATMLLAEAALIKADREKRKSELKRFQNALNYNARSRPRHSASILKTISLLEEEIRKKDARIEELRIGLLELKNKEGSYAIRAPINGVIEGVGIIEGNVIETSEIVIFEIRPCPSCELDGDGWK